MAEYWWDKYRFLIITGVLVMFWVGIMLFLYLKADEVTKHPCQVCSNKMGEDILCYSLGSKPRSVTFTPEKDLYQGPVPLGYNETIFREIGRLVEND